MADFFYNQGKGRGVELANRINNNDPTNSALIVVAINSTATDATLSDLDTLAAIESDINTAEVTNSGYARKVITALTVTVDDTNDRTDVTIANQTWTGVAAPPGAWTDLVMSYDSDTTVGVDSAIVPISQHDFAVTPDGSDITAQIAAAGIWRSA